MDILHTETNRGTQSIIIDGHKYRKANTLKDGSIAYRCTVKICKARIRTDADGQNIVKAQNEHSHTTDERKIEAKELRIRSRKQSGDISSRPSKIVRTELQVCFYIF